MIKVLFLSAWYPSRLDGMPGLFVQKHAEAVGMYCNVYVLYVQEEKHINKIEIEVSKKNRVTTYIIYYPEKSNSFFGKINKLFWYLKAYKLGYEKIVQSGFKPQIIHANVLTRTAFMAYLLHKKEHIPYVVSEHWSRYLPIRNSYHGILRKITTKLVVKKASAVFPVSENLKNAMLNHNLLNSNYKVINNVVDDRFFKDSTESPHKKKRILHISCFDEQAKNVCGILRATKKISEQRNDFELIIIGTGIDFLYVYNYAQSLDFKPDFIHFLGEKKPNEVAEWFYNCDFFVLFSNYENSPVVIAESLVCGKPVISTNVGGISEHVNESNGILIPVRDELSLAKNMDFLLDNFQTYDTKSIQKNAREKFSYQSVGKIISEEYKNILE